jgi:hexosaminidase
MSWRPVGELKNPLEPTERVLAKDFTCTLDKMKTRYVRVVAKSVGLCPPWHPGASEKAWLFADEVIVE